MFGVVTSVATARPAAAVRPGASARAATAAARPGAHARARLAVPRARVLARASARLPAVAAASAPLAFGGSYAVRLSSSRRAPLRAKRGGSLVAGGAEKSAEAETSTADKSDDVDALAERLDKLKEKSRAMLAEAEALEKSVTETDEKKDTKAKESASATETPTAATDSKPTPAASETTVKKLEPESDENKTAKKAAASAAAAAADESAGGEQSRQSVVESVRLLSGVVAGASLLAVGGSYAAGATSLLATEPVMALFGSAAAFAAVSVIDAVTPALKKREAAAEAAAAAAKAANPAKTAAKKPATKTSETTTKPAKQKSAMPAPVNKPVDASAAKKAALEASAEDMAEGVGSVIKKKETAKETSPAQTSVMRAATLDPVKPDTQWLDPQDAARMSGAVQMSGADTFAAGEELVKRDTASRVSSPFVSKAFSPLGAGGASVSGSADESKLEELRAIATQRMAKQRMYEEYVKARPAAAGRGVAARDETGFSAKEKDSSPLARFLKLVFFPVLLPFAVVKFVLRLIRNLLGGGKAAGAQ